jgi:hypothetical protein
VVREHRVSQGERLLPAVHRTLYSYDHPRLDLRGRGFLGFGEVRRIDPGLYREQIVAYDNTTRILLGGMHVYPYAGQPKTVTEIAPIVDQPQTAPSDTPPADPVTVRVTETRYIYEPKLSTFASYVVQPSRWDSSESEGKGAIESSGKVSVGTLALRRRRHGGITWDDYGNATNTSSATVGGVITRRLATYDNHVPEWLIGLPDRVESISYTQGQPMPSPQVTAYDFDSLGRLASVTSQPDQAGTTFWQRANRRGS